MKIYQYALIGWFGSFTFYYTYVLFYLRPDKIDISDVVRRVRNEELDTTMFYQIERSLVKELEEPLGELETLFVNIKGLDFYSDDAFDKDTNDFIFQYISNKTFIQGWAKELFYHEQEYVKKYKKIYLNDIQRANSLLTNKIGPNGEDNQKLIKTMKRTWKEIGNNWRQHSGVLLHEYIHVLSKKYRMSHGKYIRDIKGLFYYPPGGFREWHTNVNDDTSWRLYYVCTKEPNKSWFRYVNPEEKNKTYLAVDKSGYYNMFRLRGNRNELLWHSVYSDTHRFSVGFKITPEFAYEIIHRHRFGILL